MNKRFPIVLAIYFVLGAGGITDSVAQGTGGTLKGQIVDATGNPVSGAAITVKDSRTGLTRSVSSNPSGKFWFELAPGNYSLQLHAANYTSVEVEQVIVNIADTIDLRIPVTEVVIEEIIAYGNATQLMAAATGETGLHITMDELAQLPVSRSIEAVALLAPGTVLGDTAFGDDKSLVSFGGASVAENSYFINGLNVTNFRNGVGGSSVPFEFYEQFQIKTGGYSAEFGRSTGGVLNAVTRHGSNAFEYGVVAYSEPVLGQGRSPDVFAPDGNVWEVHKEDRSKGWTTDLYVGGPIVRDRLFFFLLYEPRDSSEQYSESQDSLSKAETADDFWGGDLTWHITNNHSMEFTAFTDKRDIVTETFGYDYDNQTISESIGVSTDLRGGKNYIARYDGRLSDRFSVSALYGRNSYNLTTLSSNDLDCPYIIDDSDSSSSRFPGCSLIAVPETSSDEREAYRLDFVYALDDHVLRAGYEQENNVSKMRESLSGRAFFSAEPGGVQFRYQTWNVGAQLPNGATVPDVNGDGSRVDTVRQLYYEYGGLFDLVSSAWYVEDTWDIGKALTASIGIRYEEYRNYNGAGGLFFDIDGQWAPRLGLAWSLGDSGGQHVMLNWGRYFLPIMSNSTTLFGGGWRQYFRYFVYDGERDATTAAPVAIDAAGMPTSEELGAVVILGDGSVDDTRSYLDKGLQPMDQYEWMLGYEYDIGDSWTVGVRYINRELQDIIEDVTIDTALAGMGLPVEVGDRYYVTTNPGTDITTYFDTDGDGVLEEIVIPAAALGYPKPLRTYEAVELTARKKAGTDWTFYGSYTWSRNQGNTEGTVKSDNGQDDANLTEDFDWPQLMDGAYGYLPNDRRHRIKAWGSWRASERLRFSASLFAESGRAINKFGIEHPEGTPPYGETYYHRLPDGSFEFTPRGTQGRTDWMTQLNLAAIYAMRWSDSADVELRADVFNIFDSHAVMEVNEHYDEQPNWFKLPTSYQEPRQLRFGVAVRF